MTRIHSHTLILAALLCAALTGCPEPESPFGNPNCADTDEDSGCLTLIMSIDSFSSVAADAPGDLAGDLHWELEALTDGQNEGGFLTGVDLAPDDASEEHTINNVVPGSYHILYFLDDDDSGDLSTGDPYYDSWLSGPLAPDDENRIFVVEAGHNYSTNPHIDLVY